MGFISRERPGRRAAHVAAVQVVDAVVARAPDLARVTAILHGATQMSAHGRKGLVLPVRGPDQNGGFRAELENLGSVVFELANPGRHDRAAGGFGNRRRNDVPKRRIKKRCDRSQHSSCQEQIYPAPVRLDFLGFLSAQILHDSHPLSLPLPTKFAYVRDQDMYLLIS